MNFKKLFKIFHINDIFKQHRPFLKDYFIPILVLIVDCEIDFICLNLINYQGIMYWWWKLAKSFEWKVFKFQNVLIRKDNMKKRKNIKFKQSNICWVVISKKKAALTFAADCLIKIDKGWSQLKSVTYPPHLQDFCGNIHTQTSKILLQKPLMQQTRPMRHQESTRGMPVFYLQVSTIENTLRHPFKYSPWCLLLISVELYNLLLLFSLFFFHCWNLDNKQGQFMLFSHSQLIATILLF